MCCSFGCGSRCDGGCDACRLHGTVCSTGVVGRTMGEWTAVGCREVWRWRAGWLLMATPTDPPANRTMPAIPAVSFVPVTGSP